jgi:hypothetical protein
MGKPQLPQLLKNALFELVASLLLLQLLPKGADACNE